MVCRGHLAIRPGRGFSYRHGYGTWLGLSWPRNLAIGQRCLWVTLALAMGAA